jgi:glycosyltransferase involved in cell wall biosynthesis
MLSVIIITKNESRVLASCLESVRFASEIIVVDSGSTDDTCEIASRYTDKIYHTKQWAGYGAQKAYALSLATQPWVLNLDADESLSPALQQEIQDIIAKPIARPIAYRIPIQMIFYDVLYRYSGYSKRHIRFFLRAGSFFDPKELVHEKVYCAPDTKVRTLKHPIHHRSYRDMSHIIDKINTYSSGTAKIKNPSRFKKSATYTVLRTTWMFFRAYVLQRGFLEGKTGLYLAILAAQAAFYRALKQQYPDAS